MRLPLPLLILASGCTWVSQTAFDERLAAVDDDADGVPAAQDCDDHDATISPAIPEVWYDGIDQHCDGGDDYDQDGDRYVALEYVGLETKGVQGSGELPGGDCDDADILISPKQPDDWYDGVDTNCDGVDDFDQDGDGYVPDDYAGMTTMYVDGSGMLPSGDCDDALLTVNPDAIDDWYDGVDTDCAGNDDFDADGDGFASLALAGSYAATTYASGTGILPATDCDDTRDDIYPGAPDDWYDGVDADCAVDDDYDQDGDGVSDPSGGGDDCDDEEPLAYPGAPEILGDSADYDCDGKRDGFLLEALPELTWVTPRNPTFAANSDNVYLSIGGAEIVRVTDTGTTTHYYDSAVAVDWVASDPSAGVDGLVAWSTSTSDPADYALGPGQGFLVDDDYVYGALGLDYGDTRAIKLVRYDLDTGSRTAANANGSFTAYEDIAVAMDDNGAFHVVGCEGTASVLQYVRMPSTWTGGFAADVEVEGVDAVDCGIAVDGTVGRIYSSERSALYAYRFDATEADPTFSEETSYIYAPLDLDLPVGWDTDTLVMADADSRSVVLYDGADETLLASGDAPTEVAAAEDEFGTHFVAWVVPGGGAWLAWGSDADGFATVELDPGFGAEDVSVWARDGYVYYAVTGGDQVAVGLAEY